jgi:hypothetical protein
VFILLHGSGKFSAMISLNRFSMPLFFISAPSSSCEFLGWSFNHVPEFLYIVFMYINFFLYDYLPAIALQPCLPSLIYFFSC